MQRITADTQLTHRNPMGNFLLHPDGTRKVPYRDLFDDPHGNGILPDVYRGYSVNWKAAPGDLVAVTTDEMHEVEDYADSYETCESLHGRLIIEIRAQQNRVAHWWWEAKEASLAKWQVGALAFIVGLGLGMFST